MGTIGVVADRNVSIRELNQNAGKIVRSVAKSGPVDITYHGDVIARLVPVTEGQTTWERLLSEGLVRPATLDREPLPKPVEAPTGRSVAEMVDETRGDR